MSGADKKTRGDPSPQGSDPCLSTRPHLHRYMERELDPIRTALVEEHLKRCARCREAREDLEIERLWFLEIAVDTPPLSERLRKKIMGKVRRQKGRASARKPSLLVARAASCAAAVLVIVLTAINFEKPGQPLGENGALVVSTNAFAATEEAQDSLLGLCSPECGEMTTLPLTFMDDRSARAAGFPATFHRGTIFVVSFADVMGIAKQVTPSSKPVLTNFAPEDPCKPDPNKDGKTDINDVAYSCQLLIGGAQPHSLEPKEAPLSESDCDDVCLRA